MRLLNLILFSLLALSARAENPPPSTADLEAAVAASPGDAKAVVELGIRYHEEERFPDAKRLLAQGLARFPRDGEIRIQYARALHETGDSPQALVQYHKAARQRPDDALPWHHMGLLYNDLKQMQMSYNCFVQALYREPDHPRLSNIVGDLLRQGGSPEEGIRFFRRMVQLQPKNANAHQRLALFLYEEKRIDEAAAQFEMALELDPGLSVAANNLSAMYFKMGRFEDAHQVLRGALKQDPENPKIREGLRRVEQALRKKPSARGLLP